MPAPVVIVQEGAGKEAARCTHFPLLPRHGFWLGLPSRRTSAISRSEAHRCIFFWETATKSTAVEFYNARLNHYFVTADVNEIADLDHGVHAGWMRTGYAFPVGTQDAASFAEPVCRFYGLPARGLDSHFYSANAGECEAVKARFGNDWLSESANVFAVDLPDSLTGECPPRTQPVFRLWNGRSDSNHRYATDASMRESMLARGFVAEGYGPQGVAMCSPQ